MTCGWWRLPGRTICCRAADPRRHLHSRRTYRRRAHRISQAAALIAQGPDPGILASQDAAAQHQAAPMALVPPPRGRPRRSDGLSAREAEVLQLLTNGSTNLEIAAVLVVSVHTVELHLQNAYRKIGVRKPR